MVCRRAYQRAITVPTPVVDLLWRSYEAFEQGGSNRQLARRVLEEQRPRWQAARAALRTRQAMLAALRNPCLPLPPGSHVVLT